jgi:ribosomal protein L13E
MPPCRFFASGHCKYGTKCSDSHDVCRFFSSPGGCRKGDSCSFVHLRNGGGSGGEEIAELRARLEKMRLERAIIREKQSLSKQQAIAEREAEAAVTVLRKAGGGGGGSRSVERRGAPPAAEAATCKWGTACKKEVCALSHTAPRLQSQPTLVPNNAMTSWCVFHSRWHRDDRGYFCFMKGEGWRNLPTPVRLGHAHAAGYDVTQLCAADISLVSLKEGGFSAHQLQAARFSASELKAVGFSASELKAAGFSAPELKAAGFSASVLNAAGLNMKKSGFSVSEVKAAGYTSAAVLREVGFFASELKASGYTPVELMLAGFSAPELKAAGFSASVLRFVGFSVPELKAAGFSASDLGLWW